jgi:hypothetical protein
MRVRVEPCTPARLNGETERPARCLGNEERSGLNNVFAGKPEKPVTRKKNTHYISAGGDRVKSNILLPSLFKSLYICIP